MLKKFLFTLFFMILSSISVYAINVDENFEDYTAPTIPNEPPWSLLYMNVEKGGSALITQETDGNQALCLKLAKPPAATDSSYLQVSGSADRFLIKTRVKVIDSSQGTFSVLLRENGGNGAITLFRINTNKSVSFVIGGVGTIPNQVIQNDIYHDISLVIDKKNDKITVYWNGVCLGSKTSFKGGNFNSSEFMVRFTNTVASTANTMEAYLDDVVICDNISLDDDVFIAPIVFKSVYNGLEQEPTFVKKGENRSKLLAINLTNSPKAVITASILSDSKGENQFDVKSILLISRERKESQTTIFAGSDSQNTIKCIVVEPESLKPFANSSYLKELNNSPFDENTTGQTLLKSNVFSAHRTSGLLYYNNKKVVPIFEPVYQNNELYIHQSNVAEAFGGEIIDNLPFGECLEKDGELYIPMNLISQRYGGIYTKSTVKEDTNKYSYDKLYMIGTAVSQPALYNEAEKYMRYWRPSRTELDWLLTQKPLERPRILMNQNDFNRINISYNIDKNPFLVNAMEAVGFETASIFAFCNAYANNPRLPVYDISTGDLLPQATNTHKRLIRYSLAYLLAKNSTNPIINQKADVYLTLAKNEIDAVCAYPNWNTVGHFLDAAEWMSGFAVAYDWLNDALGKERLQRMRTAILEFGLKPAKDSYISQQYFARTDSNWSAVCNSGVILAALAIVDDVEDRYFCIDVVRDALRSIENHLPIYAPDGASEEGPMYTDYAQANLVDIISTLDATFGQDFGLFRTLGFEKSDQFMIACNGPCKFYNFHDAARWGNNTDKLFWFAHKTNDQNLGNVRLQAMDFYGSHLAGSAEINLNPTPYDVLWYNDSYTKAGSELPLDLTFAETELISLRNSWTDKNALYLASHGGKTIVNHGHADSGTFVFDGHGESWATDLGGNTYWNDYFSLYRYRFYRTRTEGHSTLLINPSADSTHAGQKSTAFSPMIDFKSNEQSSFGILDLTQCYNDAQGGVTNVKRGIGLFGNKAYGLIRDEIVLGKSENNTVYWHMVTPFGTGITITPDNANHQFIISKKGKTLYVKYQIIGTGNVTASVEECKPLSVLPRNNITEPNDNNDAFRMLRIKIDNAPAGTLSITTKLTFDASDDLSQASNIPLDEWNLE